jgi:hypothetical protein
MSTEQKSEEELAADYLLNQMRGTWYDPNDGRVPDLMTVAAYWTDGYDSWDQWEAVADLGPSEADLDILRIALRKMGISGMSGTEEETLADLAEKVKNIAKDRVAREERERA